MSCCTQVFKSQCKYMEDYDLSTESSYLMCWDVNNLYGRALSQKLLQMASSEKGSSLNSLRNSFKTMMMTAMKNVFLKFILVISSACRTYTLISRSCLKNFFFEKCNKLVCNMYDKKNFTIDLKLLRLALDQGLILG